MKSERKNGILFHISSLPSKYGIGDLGKEAYKLVELLESSSVKLWQLLPLGPNGKGNSPYLAFSAFAGDPLYISPDMLYEWGLLEKMDLSSAPRFNKSKIDFSEVKLWKQIIFEKAWLNFSKFADEPFRQEFQHFKNEHGWWLSDYSFYTTHRGKTGGLYWNKWESELAFRNPDSIKKYIEAYSSEIEYHNFLQFMFFRQWFRLKGFANNKGVEIIGDMPLYVSHESSDVWSNQHLFMLDDKGEPELVGGVPPDYFCEDGQLWGNPVFNWDKLKQTNYQWWIARINFNLHMFNYVRIDHFRGLESFWAVPSEAENAINGIWMPAGGYEMLYLLRCQRGDLPLIAEDLGIITPEVEKLRDDFALPGMKVLQFAFLSDKKNEHLPHNYNGRNVAYTGTHDNDTIAGWWKNLDNHTKNKIRPYLLNQKGNIAERFIGMIWSSSAEWAIIPIQDLLIQGSEARMNIPGSPDGNWIFRVRKRQLTIEAFQFIKKMNELYNR
ncbi:MAG: 4-alpha-glucanotransferase [Prolixibacteraceae bacterium]|nr:4-alpha-glucanotransferase [Prolixibacteraceae bacterium]